MMRGSGKSAAVARQFEQLRKQSDAFGKVYFRRSRRSYIKKDTGAHAPLHGNWWTRLRQRMQRPPVPGQPGVLKRNGKGELVRVEGGGYAR